MKALGIHSFEFEALQAIVAAISAELEAHQIAGVRMPRERAIELRDAIAPVAFHAQRAWNDLPPDARVIVEGARAVMIVAQRNARSFGNG